MKGTTSHVGEEKKKKIFRWKKEKGKGGGKTQYAIISSIFIYSPLLDIAKIKKGRKGEKKRGKRGKRNYERGGGGEVVTVSPVWLFTF